MIREGRGDAPDVTTAMVASDATMSLDMMDGMVGGGNGCVVVQGKGGGDSTRRGLPRSCMEQGKGEKR